MEGCHIEECISIIILLKYGFCKKLHLTKLGLYFRATRVLVQEKKKLDICTKSYANGLGAK